MCTDLFRRELGVEPSAGLRLAAEVTPGTSTLAPVGGRPAMTSAARGGRRCHRRRRGRGGAAVSASRGGGGRDLRRRRPTRPIAVQSGQRARSRRTGTRPRGCGRVAQRARRRRADRRALDRRCPRPASSASSTSSKGVTSGPSTGSDGPSRPRVPTSANSLASTASGGWRCPTRRTIPRRSRRCSARSTSPARLIPPKQAAWSLSLLGRAHLLRGDYELATAALDESVGLVRAESMDRILAMAGGIARRARSSSTVMSSERRKASITRSRSRARSTTRAGRGSPDGARDLIEVVRASSTNGIDRLQDARARCSGLPDSYQWVDRLRHRCVVRHGRARGAPSRRRVDERPRAPRGHERHARVRRARLRPPRPARRRRRHRGSSSAR